MVMTPYRMENIAPGFMTMAAKAKLDAEEGKRERSSRLGQQILGEVLGGVSRLGQIALSKHLELEGAKELQKQKHELEAPKRRSDLGMSMYEKGMEIPRQMLRKKLPELPEHEILDRVELPSPKDPDSMDLDKSDPLYPAYSMQQQTPLIDFKDLEAKRLASQKDVGEGVSTGYIESAKKVLSPEFAKKFLASGMVSYYDGKTTKPKQKHFAGGTIEQYKRLVAEAESLLKNAGSMGHRQIRSGAKGIAMSVAATPYQVALAKFGKNARAFLSASRVSFKSDSDAAARRDFNKKLLAATSWYANPSADFGQYSPMDYGFVQAAMTNSAIPAKLDIALKGQGESVITEALDFRRAVMEGNVTHAQLNAIWGHQKKTLRKGQFDRIFGNLRDANGSPRFTHENYVKWNATLANLMRESAQGQLGSGPPLKAPSGKETAPSPSSQAMSSWFQGKGKTVSKQEAKKEAARLLKPYFKGANPTGQLATISTADIEDSMASIKVAQKAIGLTAAQKTALSSAETALQGADAKQSGIKRLLAATKRDLDEPQPGPLVLAKDFVKAAKKKGVKNQEELRSILLAEAQSSLPTSEQVWAKAVIKSMIGYLREFFGVIKEDGTLAMATPNDPFEKELAALARVANMPNSVGSKTRILNNVLG